jgi:hypothetical protein
MAGLNVATDGHLLQDGGKMVLSVLHSNGSPLYDVGLKNASLDCFTDHTLNRKGCKDTIAGCPTR